MKRKSKIRSCALLFCILQTLTYGVGTAHADDPLEDRKSSNFKCELVKSLYVNEKGESWVYFGSHNHWFKYNDKYQFDLLSRAYFSGQKVCYTYSQESPNKVFLDWE